jgi:hypothetical protein
VDLFTCMPGSWLANDVLYERPQSLYSALCASNLDRATAKLKLRSRHLAGKQTALGATRLYAIPLL